MGYFWSGSGGSSLKTEIWQVKEEQSQIVWEEQELMHIYKKYNTHSKVQIIYISKDVLKWSLDIPVLFCARNRVLNVIPNVLRINF